MSQARQQDTGDTPQLKGIPIEFGRQISCRVATSTETESRSGSESPTRANTGPPHVLVFVINPAPDLVIRSSMEVELLVPRDYLLRGGVTASTRYPQPFMAAMTAVPATGGLGFSPATMSYSPSSKSPGAAPHQLLPTFSVNKIPGTSYSELNYSWLAKSKPFTNYPLEVWFYTIRDSLKKQNLVPWKNPVIIDRFLPKSSRDNSSAPSSFISTATLHCGVGRNKGRRSYMEDVDFSFPAIRVNDRTTVSVFGVLDGHGGRDCAQFASDEIPMKIAALLRTGKSCPEALFTSFRECDAAFLKTTGDSSGSTANVMLWDQRCGGIAYIANTGDTRAVLSRSGKAYNLSIDRKATDPEEIARVAKEGGFVSNGRVLGSLAVSRALGDAQLKARAMGSVAINRTLGDAQSKALSRTQLSRVLIPDPEVTSYMPSMIPKLDTPTQNDPDDYSTVDQDEFIIIATDGLWDVMSSQAAVDMVRGLMKKNGLLPRHMERCDKSSETISSELSKIADSVATHAVTSLNSTDNVTVMIIRIDNLPLDMAFEGNPDPWAVNQDGELLDDIDDRSSFEDTRYRARTSSNPTPLNASGVQSVFSSFIPSSSSSTTHTADNKAPGPLKVGGGSSVDKKAMDDDDLMDFLMDDSNF